MATAPLRLWSAVLASVIVCLSAPMPVSAQPAALAATAEAEGEGYDLDDPASRAAYVELLRQAVKIVRDKVEDRVLERVEDKQAARMDNVATVLSVIALGGMFMLLAPLVLRRKYPGRQALLWKYSALSAVMFFVAVNLFAGVLLVMRTAQDAAGQYTNPQVQLVGATFDLFDNKADEMAEVGPLIIEPTLASLAEGAEQPIVSIMLANMTQLREDVSVFETVAGFFGKLDWAMGLMPIALVLLAMLLFARAARPTLEEIVRLPDRAAAGSEVGLGKSVMVGTMRNVWHELQAAGGVLVVLVAISAVAGLCLSWVLQPAIEIFMAYLTLAFVYLQSTPAASSGWILFSLCATIVFLAVNLIILVAAAALFLGKTQAIFQSRFRDGTALGCHRRFWIWSSASLVLLFGLPVVYMLVADPVMSWIVVRFFTPDNWALNMGLGPLLFMVTFIAVFWAAQGPRALIFLARYPVKAAGEEAARRRRQIAAAGRAVPVMMAPHSVEPRPLPIPPPEPMSDTERDIPRF